MMIYGKDPLKYHAQLVKTYGKIFSLKLGGYQTVFIADCDLMKEALIKKAACFNKRFDNAAVVELYTKGKCLGKFVIDS